LGDKVKISRCVVTCSVAITSQKKGKPIIHRGPLSKKRGGVRGSYGLQGGGGFFHRKAWVSVRKPATGRGQGSKKNEEKKKNTLNEKMVYVKRSQGEEE